MAEMGPKSSRLGISWYIYNSHIWVRRKMVGIFLMDGMGF